MTTPDLHQLDKDLAVLKKEVDTQFKEIFTRIKRLESQVTPRRLREAALGDITFIQDIENQIAALRVQL